MAVEQDQRPSFYQEQYLGPDDLTSTVEYGRIRLARHSLGAHTWGLAMGIHVIEKPSPAGKNQVDVFLTPGYAWDGFGRPIVVLAPCKIPAQLFQNIVYDASVDDPSKSGDTAAGHPVKIWLRYAESANTPAANGFQVCDVSNQMSRVQETFGLEIDEISNVSDQRDPVSIGGKLMDAQQALITFDPNAPQIYDASIPQQALPDDDAQALWLIPVGYVRWLPGQTAIQTGSFQQRTAKDLARSEAARQYIGVVAGTVEAAGPNVQVKARGSAPSGVLSDDLLWVEGKMRIEGDLNLFGGKLSFLNTAGQDDGVPLLVQRAKQTNTTSLQIEIGKSNQGNNMLSVGPLDSGGNFVPVFNVLDNGKVSIEGDLNLFGGKLSFLDPTGNDEGVPLLLQRTNTSLQIEIGKDNAGNNMLQVGPLDSSGNLVPVFNVLDNGKAGVGTTKPRNALGVRGLGSTQELLSFEDQSGNTIWHLNQNPGGSNSGINFAETGIADFRLFIQAGGKVGIGTSAPSNRLHVDDFLGIRQKYMYLSGGAGWSSLTYNAYHDSTNSTWVFPDATRTAMTIEMDDNGGTGRFEVWSTTSAAKSSWVKRFRIDGETGAATVLGSLDVEGTFTVNGAISLNGGMNLNGGVNFSGGVNFNGGVGFNSSVSIQGTDITAALIGLSDRRLKTGIEPLADSLAKLLSLRGVRFQWKEPEKIGAKPGPQLGLIAQEVEQVFPSWVGEDRRGYKVLAIRGFEALVIEAVRELKEELDALARKVKPSGQPA